MILSDFRCPVHGLFEASTDSDAETAPCPHAPVSYSVGPADGVEGPRQYFTDRCGLPSPWSPSPVFGQVELVTATRGRSDAKPHPLATDFREVGEGRKLSDWRKERKKQWHDHDYKIRKERAKL